MCVFLAASDHVMACITYPIELRFRDNTRFEKSCLELAIEFWESCFLSQLLFIDFWVVDFDVDRGAGMWVIDERCNPAPCFASKSAVVFPSILLFPGTHISLSVLETPILFIL